MKLILSMILGWTTLAGADVMDHFPWVKADNEGSPGIELQPERPTLDLDFQILPKPDMITIGDFLSTTGPARIQRGGGISSVGGGDFIDPIYTSAWFYGGAPIKVCRMLAYNFGIEADQVDASLQKVISFWQHSFANQSQLFRADVGHPINIHFEYSGECVGGEDLTLYLGTGPVFQNLSDLRFSQFYRMPVAYPNKNYVGNDLTWAEGYILVNKHHHFENKGRPLPDWSEIDRFEIMMAHEFGHVLGLGHDEGSIMRDDIVYQTFLNENPEQKTLADYYGKPLQNPLSNFDLYQVGESPVDAGKLSLLQEDKDIVCTSVYQRSDVRQLIVDKRDRFLKITWKSGRNTIYDDVEFLDTAVLFRNRDEAALFQIFQNGQVYLTLGRLLEFNENCATVGAGKECPVGEGETFYWKPGSMQLESLFPAPLPVVEYGHYPNDATHFSAHSQPVRMGRVGPAMALLDYGFRLQLVAGEAQQLECNYHTE